MQRNYDLFEVFPDGTVIWRAKVSGLPEVRQKLADLAATTANECCAIHLSTQDVVARMNVGGKRPKITKRLVAQIGYDPELVRKRTLLLRSRGYEVVSVVGNECARLVLDLSQDWDCFIIGHGAPKEVREEMVAWLKARFPRIPVLALNPPVVPVLQGADYNVQLNSSELWLGLVSQAARRLPDRSPAPP